MNQTFDNYVHCLMTTLAVIINTNPEFIPALTHSGNEGPPKGFLSPAVHFCLLAYYNYKYFVGTNYVPCER